MASLRLYVLGPPRLERDGRLIELAAAKAVALLAYLAAARSPQSREHLLGLLWPESPGGAARKNLRNTLWAIRKSLGDDALRADDDCLALHDALWVDVREFVKIADFGSLIADSKSRQSTIRNQQSAIDLYGGPFLDGFSLSDAPEFEIWLTTEREHLGQLHLRVLSGLVEAQRADGNWPEVIALAQRALAHDNLQEAMYRVLMEAHGRLGERAEALRSYDALSATLARELGVEPLPETETLRAAILSGEIQPAAPPPRRADRIRKRQPIMGEPARAPFIGRRAECAALDAEFETAANGRARIVLLTGELGIGKSRLWQEWSSGLPPDLTLLEARCLESTQVLPFAPLTELFARRVYRQGLFAPGSRIPLIWLAEVARLLPDIRHSFPDLPAPITLPPEEERRRVFEAFTQCLLALDARPLVLFIDDLQWADRATLDWLDYLVRRPWDQPLLLVAAYRPEDTPAALAHLVAQWGREGMARRLPLGRLTTDESAALVASLVGDPALRATLAGRVQTQSAGNPYFLIELCRAAPGDLPSALTELVRARLAWLPGATRQVLQAAAVLEPDFEFVTLRRACGRSQEEALDALDTLLNAAVLVERGGPYAFAHPLVATVVRDGLSGARRAFLHRRVAEALEDSYVGRLPQIAGRLATLYAQAGEPARAARYAEMAAEHALTLAAYAEAADFYRQAVAFDITPARQLGLGRALYRKGDLPEARIALETALEEFETQGDRQGAAQTCLTLYDTHLRAGHFDEVVRWAERGLTYMDAGADSASRAFALHLLGAAKLHARYPLAEAETHLVEAGRLAMEYDLPEVAARSRFGQGNILAQRGDLAGALHAYREAIALAQTAGDQFHEILGHNNTAYHALLLGDLTTAREHVEIGLTLAQARGLYVMYQWLYSTRGEIALAERRWDTAEDWFKRGLGEAEKYDNLEMKANYLINLGLVARGRSDLDGALQLLDSASDIAPAPPQQAQIDLWLTELYLARGERAAAAEALTRAEAQLAGDDRGRLQAWAAGLRHALDPKGSLRENPSGPP